MSIDPSRMRTKYVVIDCNGYIVNRQLTADVITDALEWVDWYNQPGHADPSSAPFSVIQITELAPL